MLRIGYTFLLPYHALRLLRLPIKLPTQTVFQAFLECRTLGCHQSRTRMSTNDKKMGNSSQSKSITETNGDSKQTRKGETKGDDRKKRDGVVKLDSTSEEKRFRKDAEAAEKNRNTGDGVVKPDSFDKQKRVTRKDVEEAEKNWKEHYLTMPQEAKRELYKCGSKFQVLDGVQFWPDYAAKIRETYDRYDIKPEDGVDGKLNMKISLWRGDITKLEIDSIVNAANGSLMGGGGVDGAIHSAAGQKLLEECIKLDGCSTGDAKITGGYKLPAKYVIHTVGPIGVNAKMLASCYKQCLNLAKENNLRTIAFPCISTGIYGYDVEKATPVVMTTVKEWLKMEKNMDKIDRIIFCVFLIKDVEVYEWNLLKHFPVWLNNHDGAGKGQKEKQKSKAKEAAQSTPEKPKQKKVPEEEAAKNDADSKHESNENHSEQKASKRSNVKPEKNNGSAEVSNDKHGEVKAGTDSSGTTSENKDKLSAKDDDEDSSPAAKKKPPNPEKVLMDTGEANPDKVLIDKIGEDTVVKDMEEDSSPAAKMKPPNPEILMDKAGDETDAKDMDDDSSPAAKKKPPNPEKVMASDVKDGSEKKSKPKKQSVM